MGLDTVDFLRGLGDRHRKNPLETAHLTLPQLAFAQLDATEGLWRDGNQLGKSWALAWDLHMRCRKTHPYQRNRHGRFNALIASVSYEQMAPLMEKIWLLAPKDEIDPRNGFDPGRGITGKPPRLVYISGPGKGSVINFATYAAGARRIAGWTGDYLGLDEPPDETFYGEALPRIMRRRGVIRVTMTPTPDMPDQSWLREKVKGGQVQELNFGLKSEYLVPDGYNFPWLSDAEIETYRKSLLAHERSMRIDGSWVALSEGRWLDAFTADNIVEFGMRELRGWKLVVGMDHGTPGGKQSAVLTAIKDASSDRPRVRFVDECVNEGFTKPEDDVHGVLEMLKTHGLSYDDVDDWIGDVPTESKVHQIRKSNSEFRREMAKALGRHVKNTKHIATPTKYSNSMTMGMRVLNTLFGRRTHGASIPDAAVHPRCEQFANACWTFKGDTKDPVKDVLDGGRYAVEKGVTGKVAITLNAAY
jgi:phage terminase large subunit-like protein